MCLFRYIDVSSEQSEGSFQNRRRGMANGFDNKVPCTRNRSALCVIFTVRRQCQV
jgi:hypothetical protein